MIKMIGTNILVTEAEKEQKTASGIILTESIDKGSKPGLVLSVGPEANFLLKGQRVFLANLIFWPLNVAVMLTVGICFGFIGLSVQ